MMISIALAVSAFTMTPGATPRITHSRRIAASFMSASPLQGGSQNRDDLLKAVQSNGYRDDVLKAVQSDGRALRDASAVGGGWYAGW